MLWGNEASVLVGDFLLGQAFKMMVEVGSLEALDVLSAAAAVIAEGEVMQLAAAKNTETTEDDYLAVIRAKTAALFAAACEVGADHRRAAPRRSSAACRSYGANLGIAFQLVDDALDYGGASPKLGKNVGDDFREGKITLPVVLVLPPRRPRTSAPSGSARWRRARSATATSSRPSRSCAATAPSRTRSSAPATTAPWRATRWRCSRTAPCKQRCSKPSISASRARTERAGKPLIRRCAPPSPRLARRRRGEGKAAP